MDPIANLKAQFEVALQIQGITEKSVEYWTCAEKELYHAAERLAELVMAAHHWRTVTAQAAQGAAYVPADNPDEDLVTLTP